MAQGLTGKSVIVTGAAHGVGLGVAQRLCRAGASVMMTDADEDRLDIEVEHLNDADNGGRATAFHGDLRQRLTMSNLMAATLDAHDGIDVLVNASRLLVRSDPLLPEADNLEEALATNVTANLRLTQIVARRMMEAAEAEGDKAADRVIVNIASVYDRRSLPELLAYSVCGAALDQLTRTMAVALAPHRIRVNAVAVGGVAGQSFGEDEDLNAALGGIVPSGRLVEPMEAAEAVAFLASPTAGFISGQILAVDGGRLMMHRDQNGPS